jgi:catechol 2,3-dioxygenase-like lactoylglutathione lyase family enzyme
MPATKVFHVGFLAHDIEEARERYALVLGVEWGDVLDYEFNYSYGGETHLSPVRACFTIGGPPFLELLQTQDNDGPFSRKYGEGLHHVSIWEQDVDAKLEELARIGVEPFATVAWPDGPGSIAAYLPPEALKGTLVEIVRHGPDIPGYTEQMPGTGF